MNRIKEKLINWIQEWKLGIILLGNALLFTILFIQDIHRKSEVGNREIIGNMVFRYNQVERRFNRETTWDKIDSNNVVTNYDAIRSDKNSSAVIKLVDGTEIQMDEESMLILELHPKQSRINFEKGSINVKKTPIPGNPYGSITVDSPKGQVKINDGDVIVAKKNSDNLNVAVSRGEAEVNIGGKTVQLKKNQILKTNDSGEIEAKSSKVVMESPMERILRLEKKILSEQKLPLSTSISIASPNSDSNQTNQQNNLVNQETSKNTESSPPSQARIPNYSEQKSSRFSAFPNNITTPPKVSPPTGSTHKESEEERRKKEQEALERFLKL